nr:DUF4255 domain-containing protein [Paenibacillus sp. 481]
MKLLRNELTPYPITQPELIGLASPADKGDLSLSLFLYNIRESVEYRQAGMVQRGSGQPMAVELFYLMTAHSNADLSTRALDEHRILGRAMQVLYDNGIIGGSTLQGTLSEHNESVRIVREHLPFDMMTSLFPHIPYKLSVSYLVGPVYLDSARSNPMKRVRQQDTQMEEN